MKPGIQFTLWLFGLAFRLIVASVLTGILYILFGSHLSETSPAWLLPILLLLVGYTWAVYYHLPLLRKQSRPQRILTSSGLAALIALMTFLMVHSGAAALDAFSIRKTDQRVETVTLPSGEVLENHTYLEDGGWGVDRYNALSLKNPATGASERIGDPNCPTCGFSEFEVNLGDPSLLQRYPHPQEFVFGNRKALIIGPYVCKRFNGTLGPEWNIDKFVTARGDATEYLQSFWKPADPTQASRLASGRLLPGEGPRLDYQIDSLDLTNGYVLTVKRVPWKLHRDSPEFRHGFPKYLVYDAHDHYEFPGQFAWKFDLLRTSATNGPSWKKPMPFKMALDYSVITFRGTPGVPWEEKRAVSMARPGAKEIATVTLELSDLKPSSVECRYTVSNTNHITEHIEAMYGFASNPTNRFGIVWQPQDPDAWPVPGLTLDQWWQVGYSDFNGNEGNLNCEEFIRLRRIEP